MTTVDSGDVGKSGENYGNVMFLMFEQMDFANSLNTRMTWFKGGSVLGCRARMKK